MLVENALKHNISTKKSPLIVHISIGNERITVRNNLQLRNYVASNGAGLKNLQRQYALYGTLVEILKDEKEFVVKLPFVGEAQYSPLPEEESGNVHLVHSPRHTHAAAKSEGGGSDKEQHPRRVEGEHGQKRLGQNGENG